tara:strand:- start:91 stop:282 length:192 start_codon:yes stop_codon:yes gene_type:complete
MVLFILLGINFSHSVDLSAELLVVICDLDYEWSVLIVEVNTLVNLSEGSTVNKSGNGESFLED